MADRKARIDRLLEQSEWLEANARKAKPLLQELKAAAPGSDDAAALGDELRELFRERNRRLGVPEDAGPVEVLQGVFRPPASAGRY